MMRLYYHPAMLEHDTGAGHPERADRLRAIREALTSRHPDGVEWGEPEPVGRAPIEAVHAAEFVDEIESWEGDSHVVDPDTRISEGSIRAAHLAAGAGIQAVESVLDGACNSAFALVRPPGHHAESNKAMGFCLYNNVAVAAEYLRRERGLDRVLVLDWDVHHGNGTEEIFYRRGDVLYLSVHQSPLFPGTGQERDVGAGDGQGATVNLPYPAGMGDADYTQAFERLLMPVARQFDPDFVLISAGYDAHVRDPLAGMNLSAQAFGAMAGMVADLADEVCEGRLAFFLEGGYDLEGLADSVVATVRGALGRGAFEVVGEPSTQGLNRLESVIDRQRSFWEL